jgi:hypothetical protein
MELKGDGFSMDGKRRILIVSFIHSGKSIERQEAFLMVKPESRVSTSTDGSSTRPRTARTAWVGASHCTTWYASRGNQYCTGTNKGVFTSISPEFSGELRERIQYLTRAAILLKYGREL